MKKIVLAALAALAVVGVALAAAPTRNTISVIGATNWTNSQAALPLLPVRIDVYGWVPAADTVTVSRIRGTRTNTLTSVVTASGVANAPAFGTNYLYLVEDDVLRFTATAGGTGTVEMISLVQE